MPTTMLTRDRKVRLTACVFTGLLLRALPGAAQAEPPPPRPSCGPPEYCARTDTRIQAVTRVPVLGPAGSVVRDPDFGSRILRVTDQNTLARLPNVSSHTDSAGEADEWNTDSSYFYVQSTGGHQLIFRFEPANMRATYTGVDLGLPPFSWRAGGQFSHVNPDLLYGLTMTEHPTFQQYDISRGRSLEIHDPASCLKMEAGARGHVVAVSADDSRLLGMFGSGQDGDRYVYVYDRRQGCRWYDTQTGEIRGKWGPSGTIAIPDRFGIHNTRVSLDGKTARVIRGKCFSNCSATTMFWNIETLEVNPCGNDPAEQCGGHHAMGYTHEINSSGYLDPFNVVIRPHADLRKFTSLISSFPASSEKPVWMDKHWSWSNDHPTDTAPVCGASYSNNNPTTPGALPVIRRAWESEIICVETDGKKSTVWRFAHHFSSAMNGFFSTPRGNVSQDGRFYIFSSDWMNTLGTPRDGKGHRVDAFIVELK